MRLIDADALIPKMNECVNDNYITDFDAIATILDAPTIEPNLVINPDEVERGDVVEIGENIVVMHHDDYYDMFLKSELYDDIESCEDAISREAVIKVFEKDYDDVFDIMTDIEALPSVAPSRPSGEWIPCSERLPEEHRHYLCTVTRPQYIDKIYTVECYWCGRWYGWLHEEVTAWMPLPEPYKESE